MEIKTIKDYYEDIHSLFPQVPLSDIKRILSFGWKSLYLENNYGGDVLITDNGFWSYIGTLRKDSIKHFQYYIKKLTIKLRVLYKRKKIKWDGYYYFALTDEQYQSFSEQRNKRGRPRKKFNYGNQVLYKILDECKIKEYNRKYIFKVPYPIDLGYTIYKKDFISENAELIITRSPLKFKDILVSNNNYDFI